MNSEGGNHQNAGAVDLGGSAQAASANFQSRWSNAEDAMAASIIRLESQKDELNAEVALLREQALILQAERDEARATIDKWRECAKALADAVDYYHPALRDVEDGFSAERAAIVRFDELEASK